jgi:hypothetical protein
MGITVLSPNLSEDVTFSRAASFEAFTAVISQVEVFTLKMEAEEHSETLLSCHNTT